MVEEKQIPEDMRVTYINKKTGNYWPNWKLQKNCNKEELNKVNLKSMYPNEIVFDLENKEYKELLKRLEADNITKHKVIDTKSRGYHVHEFFEGLNNYSLELRNEIRKIYIKKYNCDLSKASEITLISISGRPHFKSGQIAELITDIEGFNTLDDKIVQQAKSNSKIKGVFMETKQGQEAFIDYFEKDPFWLLLIKINWTKMPMCCNFNNCVAKNLAIACRKSGKTKEEIDAIMKPFIKQIKGYPYKSFEGWLNNKQLDEYNYYELNNWWNEYADTI